MFVPFSALSPLSRIWIFQADRRFTRDEVDVIEDKLRNFTEQWNAHGQALRTSFALQYDHFIILAADESHQGTSGCSIDSSVRVLKEIEQTIDVCLFDRNLVAFKIGEQIILVPLSQLKQKFQEGMLNEDVLTFDNLVTTKSQFETAWLVPPDKTWLKRYMPDELMKVK